MAPIFTSTNQTKKEIASMPILKAKVQSPNRMASIQEKVEQETQKANKELRLLEEENERIENLIEYISKEAEVISIEEAIRTLTLLIVRDKLNTRAEFIFNSFLTYEETKIGRISLTKQESYRSVFDAALNWFSRLSGLHPSN